MKHCPTCDTTKPLDSFETRRNAYGRVYHRNVCKTCRQPQKKSPLRALRKKPSMRNFANPLPITYRKGTRCWCCRRNSNGKMLCRMCGGHALPLAFSNER